MQSAKAFKCVVGLVLVSALSLASESTGQSGVRARARADEKVIQITARRFEFAPDKITVKKGEPVVLELKSEDVKHGFSLPDFSVRSQVSPGQATRVRFVPDKVGEFTFVCDVFCGDGHEDMEGKITVTD